MSPVHLEAAFGDAIVAAMVAIGWREGSPADYRPELGLDTAQLYEFIGDTQPKQWDDLLTYYGNDATAAQRGFAQRLDQAISNDGLLHVLRRGVKDRGVLIRVAYFKPSLVMPGTDPVMESYRKNRLTVVRELAYATKPGDRGKRLDLTLFVNGIPVATAELKNPLTGQGVEHAKRQYRTDRDPTDLIFTKRAVANFAVDPDLVFVTTRLRGKDTVFLPFNTGSNGPGQPGGGGNPRPSRPGTYATSYLWEDVWQPDNWLELLERYAHTRREKRPGARTTTRVIFPRFHQWDAVRKLTAHAARHGAGHNYLVMASAGSGKSNTIAWLAHRLTSLHTAADPAGLDPEAAAAGVRPGEPVFDKVIVITDRRGLDRQLRDTVASFEQTPGLVMPIREHEGAKSAQLAAALSRETGKIITVTLHTFPALVDYLKRNPTEIRGRRFALIVDEAHSSQSGDAAAAVRDTLRDLGLDADDDGAGATAVPVSPDDVDAKLRRRAQRRGHSPNLSYFAFTATPKHKTLELFGTLDVDGTYRPFHTYSMRQAIEEGFILDPLCNYLTYATYWKLVNENPDDREVDPAKANPLLARFALTHDATVAQHAQVIAEHFFAHTRGRLGGRAKAMVVTGSRQSAVQLGRAIKRYIAERGYPYPGVLVAFSGTLTYDGEETTEVRENGGLPESQLQNAFAYCRADDPAVRAGAPGKPEYRILVVAEKYQTGFDQPMLTTMYVVKTLVGIAAVQTLSRINRTAERKSQSDLAVLDFVNDAEDIQQAFRPFYEQATTLPSDPNLLFNAQSRVMSAGILDAGEMRSFAAAYLAAEEQAAGSPEVWKNLHAELYRLLDPAIARYVELVDSGDEQDRETAEAFRADLQDYVRKYGFLAQIVQYSDPDLEALHLYGRHLLNRLPRRNDGGVDIGEVDLSHLRVEKTGQHDLRLEPEGPAQTKGFGDGSGSGKEPDKSLLSELIERFNERHGTSFTAQDVVDKPYQEALAEPKVRQAAVANNEEDFGLVFIPVFEDKMADHIDTIAEFGGEYFRRGSELRQSLNRSARAAAWRLIRQQEGVLDNAA